MITDYPFGAHSSALYTTASVFFAGTIGPRDILFVFGDADQSHELALKLTGRNTAASPGARAAFTTTSAGTIISISPGTLVRYLIAFRLSDLSADDTLTLVCSVHRKQPFDEGIQQLQ